MNTVAADFLKRHEGFRQFPYKDTVGKLSIGYGLNLDDVGIDEEEAELLLHRRVISCERTIRRLEPVTFGMLSATRQAVLIDMSYQLGINGLLKFVKMWEALARSDYREAAIQMLKSKWAEQTPARAEHLAKVMETNQL